MCSPGSKLVGMAGLWKAAMIHTEGGDYFPAVFFTTLFLFIARQKVAVQKMEELAGVVDTP